jgi:vitamin B12 transporter
MKTLLVRNDHPAARSLAAVGVALAASSAAAQQTPPEEIIVTSSMIEQPRRQIGTAVSAIDFEEIELRGYSDLADVLRTQTGIGVSNTGGPGKSTVVRIRGEESFRTLLMIDGVKAVDPSALQVSPIFESLLTTSDLQRVEVLRGPQGFIYGADAGGVVNVLTKRGAGDLGGRVGVEYGDYSTRKVDAALSGGSDQADYFVSVVDFATDGFNARATDTVLQDDDGADNTTLHAKLGWNITDDLRLQLVARDIDAEAAFDLCFAGGPSSFFISNDCVGTTEQTTYKISADYSAGAFSNSFGFSEVDVARDSFAEGISAFATEGALSRVEYTGSYAPSDALTLVYGVDLQDEELTDGTGPQSRDQNGYYFEYQGAFDDKVFLSVGARYDDNDDFGSYTSSRLSLAYVHDLAGDRSLKYRASVGTGFRAPSLFEVATNRRAVFPPAAGTMLTEETSQGYDIGVEYDTQRAHFEVTYFDQEIEDAIEFDLAGFSGYVQTAGASTSTGVEVATDISVGERWQLLANWTNNDAKDAAGQQRLRRPDNVANLGVLYRAADERLSVLANWRLSSDAVDVGNTALPSYEVLDLSISFAASDLVQIYGRLQNVTDETYYEADGYNTAGQAIYGGVRLRF